MTYGSGQPVFVVGDTLVRIESADSSDLIRADRYVVVPKSGDGQWYIDPRMLKERYTPVSERAKHIHEHI